MLIQIVATLALLQGSLRASSEEDTCPASGCVGARPADMFEIPNVVIGCWQLLERSSHREAAIKTLMTYARAGFTAFDTADIYGPSEEILGDFRRRWTAEMSGSPPPRFFTKYVTDDASAAEANRVNAQSRGSLRTEAPDLVQFHWWSLQRDGSRKDFLKAGRELMRLKKEGKVLHLGGCNMDTTHLRLMFDDGMDIAMNQVQYSLLDRRAENGMLAYCRTKGIKLSIFGVVGGGLLSDGFLGISKGHAQAKLDSVSRRMYWSSLQRWTQDWELFQRLLRTLKDVGARKEPPLPVAAVASAWALRRLTDAGAGGGLILGVRDARHLAEHTSLLRGEVALDTADMHEIAAVLAAGNAPSGDIWHQERGWA